MIDVYAMYLRKSRSDMQAELRGEGDALARHRRTLTELARHMGIQIGEVYAEIASADSIAGRPEMRRMLSDLIGGSVRGVLCMDIDRLGRGGTADQERILRTFALSDTLIITPGKTYDLNKPADEDFGEQKLFFSRFEYKTIKRRLYTGRVLSAEDGWYLGSRAPYGYERVPAQGKDGPTLRIKPEEAEVVRDLIFAAYANGKSSEAIANELDQRGIRPNYSAFWQASTIRNMLKNPIYIGMIRWEQNITRDVADADGAIVRKRVKNPSPRLNPGRHPAIISMDLWERVQAIIAGHPPRVDDRSIVRNPLCGLVVCARCGWIMQRGTDGHGSKKYKRRDWIKCQNKTCNQVVADLETVEEMILRELDAMFTPADELHPLAIERRQQQAREAEGIAKQIAQAEAQQERLHDLLERGVYSVEDFIKRRERLSQRLTGLRMMHSELTAPDPVEERIKRLAQIVPRSQSIREAYDRAATPAEKNELLKSIIKRVVYDKTEQRRGRYDDMERGIKLVIELLF